MRTFALLIALSAFRVLPGLAAEVTLNFDDVASGTVINDHYADQGVILIGRGNGGPFDVEARESCVTPASPPNVISLSNLGPCPEFSVVSGFVHVEFETPQPRVSIMVTHVDATTTTYLRAYGGEQFLDQKYGDVSRLGVPQKLEITRKQSDPWITAVEFGAFSGSATFDDLYFAIGPVATQRSSWSLVKSRF